MCIRDSYTSWNEQTHMSKENIEPYSSTVFVGIDFGLTPAATFGQRLVTGQWLILQELVCFDMGVTRFAELLKHEIAKNYKGLDLEIYGDPAGDFRSQTDETTPFQILRHMGIRAVPAPSNDVLIRLESVNAVLSRMVDGESGILLDPKCNNLIRGFSGGYHYRRLQVSGERYDEKPNKNRFSHIHDALQYLLLGAGEGRALTIGKKTNKPIVVYVEWIASINPNIISAKPHKLFIINK